MIHEYLRGNRAVEAAGLCFAVRRFRFRVRRRRRGPSRRGSMPAHGQPGPASSRHHPAQRRERGRGPRIASGKPPRTIAAADAATAAAASAGRADSFLTRAKVSALESFLEASAIRRARLRRSDPDDRRLLRDSANALCRFYANLQVHQKCAFSLTDIFCAGGKVKNCQRR